MVRAHPAAQRREPGVRDEASGDGGERRVRAATRPPPRRRFPLAVTLALLVVAAMAPLIAFGAFGIDRLVTSAREKELDRLSAAARALMNATERELRGYRETAEVLAQSSYLRRGDVTGFAEAAYDAVAPAGGHFVLIDAELRQIVNTQVPRDTPLPDPDEPEAIRRVLASGKSEVGDLNLGNPIRETHFDLRVPVPVDGRTGYVLAMTPRPDLLRRVIEGQHLSEFGWFAAILDRNGRIVARSHRHEDFFGQPAAPDFIARLIGTQGRITSVDLEGRGSITAYHTSPDLGWRALVWAPEKTILAPARTAERFILSIALLAMTLSLASAAIAMRVIRTPLLGTADTARDLAAGRPVTYVPSRLLEADEIRRVIAEMGTALRAREAALAAAEERLRLAQQVADVGVIEWDIGADRADASEGILGIYGEEAGAWILGNAFRGFMSSVHPEDRDRIARAYARLKREGGRFSEDFRILRRGETRWISASGEFMRDGRSGEVVRMLAINFDITERKRIELALRDRDATLRLALDAAYAIAFTWDIGADVVRRLLSSEASLPANPTRPERLADVEQVVHPEDRGLFRAAIDTALDDPACAYRARYRIVRPDGETRWLEEWGRIERESDGTPTRLVGVSIDVTERRRVEAELAARLAELESLYEAAPIGLALFDREFRFVRINAAAARFDGLPVESHLGRNLWEVVPGLRPQIEPVFRHVLDGGHPVELPEISGETLAHPGVARQWSARIYPVHSHRGDVVGIGVVAEDITERKQREAQMRFVMRELTHRSKNLLAVIQAMARQTARGTSDTAEFVDRFADRLAALARSHDLLVSKDWIGADLHALARQQLAPFVDSDDGRAALRGPRLTLKPEVAQSVGMAFHELATNASKYGALSVPGGRIELTWQRIPGPAEEMLRIEWRETGGPPYAPPERRGFGRSVVESMIAAATHGEARIDWRPEGVHWRLDMPATWLVGTSSR
jgi:PAS domain S-box-containing protein